ncbi:tripartite-type tricarboxylate transporter receptor subunit TctC [Advenella incenata]|uniref:Tripartite-type tricarboxylate transporter receptor subunit TctC n=1 Tax=Advenella incenata TaxID=267800 RepID=A0A4Q7V884_9BURK|nr:tripartite tricarboxylate transporter substrate binding protein [Advenella incenata]RZT92876.1 tripartite-type tricarboxylate transporter receptor subunit TctC [Advenella incenata]
MKKSPLAALWATAVLAAAIAPAAGWAAYPEKPIKMIVSFPPGSGTDTNARYAAKNMSEKLGVPVLVENKPGGNSFIAAEAVANAKPDGYTLLFASNSPVATNVAMFKSLPYDPVKGLTPLAKLSFGAMGVAVNASAPYSSIPQLLEYAKKHPGKMNYGSGSASYRIATELFLSMAQITARQIPYKGASPALTDLASGQVDFVFADYGAILPLANAGKVNIIAVTGTDRLATAPSIPTLKELGYPDYYMVNWTAAFGPAGLPDHVRDLLSQTLEDIYRTDDAKAFLAKINWEAFPGNSGDLARFQRTEIERWSQAAARAGIPKQ